MKYFLKNLYTIFLRRTKMHKKDELFLLKRKVLELENEVALIHFFLKDAVKMKTERQAPKLEIGHLLP